MFLRDLVEAEAEREIVISNRRLRSIKLIVGILTSDGKTKAKVYFLNKR